MANHFSILALRTSWTIWKGKKIRTLKDELSGSVGAQHATGDQWRNNSRKTEEIEPKQHHHPVVDVMGDGSKSDAIKSNIASEPVILGPWIKANWKWSNRRWYQVNTDILGIIELKWTGMGEFNSNDRYIYYCGQEVLRRNGIAIIVNKKFSNVVLGCSLKNKRMISLHFQG